MELDLDHIIHNAKGEPFFLVGLDGNAVYNLLVQWKAEGTDLAECLKRIESLAGGKENIKPMDLGDLFYRANERSPKMTGDSREDKKLRADKRVRGQLEEKLTKRGQVEFTVEQVDAIKEDCEVLYSGALLLRLDRIFAQAVLDDAPKAEPSVAIVPQAKDGAA
jgi:hypothetical protein